MTVAPALAPTAVRTVPGGRAMATLFAAVFLVSLGYAANLPLLQPYLGRYISSDSPERLAWHVGMLGAVYTFALFAFAPWWGSLSDRYGRTSAMAGGLAVFIVGSVLAALAPVLAVVYVGKLLAGAGAAAIVPTAQATIADISSPDERGRRFVLIGSASFIGYLAGPAYGAWLAGPAMGVPVNDMPAMLKWPTLLVAALAVPLLLLIPWCLGSGRPAAEAPADDAQTPERRRFVHVSMLLALLASFGVGTFEVGFNLFGGQRLGLTSKTLAAMFVTCSIAMLVAQATLLLPGVRRRIDHRWVAATFVVSAVALSLNPLVPDAAMLGVLIAVVGTGAGMIGPVLSYDLVERHHDARGRLLGRQASAGNLGLALGSLSAGSLFGVHPSAPFWAAALVLSTGAVAAMRWWGPARAAEVRLAGRPEVHPPAKPDASSSRVRSHAKEVSRYVPALGIRWLTPAYDAVVAATTRERRFKTALIEQARIDVDHRVLDLACGTGTLSVWIKQRHPSAQVTGLDGDATVLSIAERKARRAGAAVNFDRGRSTAMPYADGRFERVVCSLFFHHLAWTDKEQTTCEIHRVLRPGGELHVADWGPASGPLTRAGFFAVQLLDGLDNTRDNVQGRLPALFRSAGFAGVAAGKSFDTMFGTLVLYRAVKPLRSLERAQAIHASGHR